MTDLIRRTAEAAADWWTDRLMAGDKAAFRASLIANIEDEVRRNGWSLIECDYDPQGHLLTAVRAAGLECEGTFFSARGILPEKHETDVSAGKIIPKEGYGNWTDPILIEEPRDD